MSRVHLWRYLTGGGDPAAFLRWLSAMWELWRSERAVEHGDFIPRVLPAVIREDVTIEFDEWLAVRAFYEFEPQGCNDKMNGI